MFAVGHYGDARFLAGVALGNMFCVVTGFSPGFGMATAADTLGSQAYGRDSKSPLVGIVLQQSVLILMLLAVPVGIVWWFAEPIFLLMRQDAEVAALGGLYCRVLILGLPAIYSFEALKKYTQVQGTASACRGRATAARAQRQGPQAHEEAASLTPWAAAVVQA